MKRSVVLASILPANRFPWRPDLPNPTPSILAMNAWIKDYAARNDCVYLDYYSAMADPKDGLKDQFAKDAIHPNKAGYGVVGPLAEHAVAEAFSNPQRPSPAAR